VIFDGLAAAEWEKCWVSPPLPRRRERARIDMIKSKEKSKEIGRGKDGFVKVKQKTCEEVGKEKFWPKPKRHSNERVVDLAGGNGGE